MKLLKFLSHGLFIVSLMITGCVAEQANHSEQIFPGVHLGQDVRELITSIRGVTWEPYIGLYKSDQKSPFFGSMVFHISGENLLSLVPPTKGNVIWIHTSSTYSDIKEYASLVGGFVEAVVKKWGDQPETRIVLDHRGVATYILHWSGKGFHAMASFARISSAPVPENYPLMFRTWVVDSRASDTWNHVKSVCSWDSGEPVDLDEVPL